MAQNFTNTPAFEDALVSADVRDNFAALLSSHAGSSTPSYGVPGTFWFQTSTRTMRLYGTTGFKNIFKLDANGDLEEVFDPRLFELFVSVSTGPVSNVVRNPAGVGPVQSFDATLLGSVVKSVTINRTNGLVSSIVVSIPALSFNRTTNILRLPNGLFNGTSVT